MRENGLRRGMLLLSAAAVLMAVVTAWGPLRMEFRTRQLETALRGLPEGETTLEEAIPFPWEQAFFFGPYTTREEMETATGVEGGDFHSSVSEGQLQLALVQGERLLVSVCDYPDRLGYSIESPGPVAFGEHVRFSVEKRGALTALRAIPPEK